LISRSNSGEQLCTSVLFGPDQMIIETPK
jgi:hypothetical protein